MRLVVAGIVVTLAAVAAAGVVVLRQHRGEDAGLPPDAVRVADRFVEALVVDPERRPHISLSIGVVQDDMLAWSAFLDREGINTIERGGLVEERCEVPFPIAAPDRRLTSDCVAYQVRGRIPTAPIGPAVMTARMRVWLIFRRGAWRVAELDFTPRNGFRSTSKAFFVEGY
jgi:hypothetical protein